MVLEESSERRSWTSWVMNCNPSRCFLRPLRHADHEGRAFGVLHDAPHLVDDQQAGLGVLGRCGPHRLGADHRGGRPELRLQEVQVEDGDQRLVGE